MPDSGHLPAGTPGRWQLARAERRQDAGWWRYRELRSTRTYIQSDHFARHEQKGISMSICCRRRRRRRRFVVGVAVVGVAVVVIVVVGAVVVPVVGIVVVSLVVNQFRRFWAAAS